MSVSIKDIDSASSGEYWLELPGNDTAYIEAPNGTLDPATDSFTITLKAHMNKIRPGSAVLFGLGDDGAYEDMLGIEAFGSSVILRYRDASSISRAIDFMEVNAGTFYYYTVTYDSTTGELRTYVDGDFKSSATELDLDPGAYDFYIGCDSTTVYTRSLDGVIGDVRIWNIARSETEINNDLGEELTGSETGLIRYYKMNEGSGTTLVDYVGTNDGTISEGTWVDTSLFEGTLTDVEVVDDGLQLANNYALSFDGVDDYVDLGDLGSLSYPFTIETSFKYDINQGEEFRTVWLATDFSANDQLYTLQVTPDNQARVLLYPGSFNGSYLNEVLVDGEEYSISFVFNSDTDKKVYVNGNLDIEFTDSIPLPTGVDKFALGTLARNSSYETFWSGIQDDFRYWNTARTQQEIQDNMNTVLTGDETGLVAYYKFDEGTGTTLTDYAGSNDGTIYGASWVDNYTPQGNRISPQLDLSTIDVIDSSVISWAPSNDIEYISASSASELGLTSGTSKVKGESDSLIGGCSGALTFEQALELAHSVGARLPTMQEVKNGAVNGTGCYYDYEMIWTCEKGSDGTEHWVTAGDPARDVNSYPGLMEDEIRSNNETAFLRFVADVDLNRADPYIVRDDIAISNFFGSQFISVETSVDNQLTWDTATNGGSIANIQGADTLDVRQILSTTDTTVTPVLEDITVEVVEFQQEFGGSEAKILISEESNGIKVYKGSSESYINISEEANGIKVYKGSSESYINISEESTVFKLIDVGIEAEVLILEESTVFKLIDVGSEAEILINSTANGFKVYKGYSQSEVLIDAQISLICISWRKIKYNESNWQNITDDDSDLWQTVDKQVSDWKDVGSEGDG